MKEELLGILGRGRDRLSSVLINYGLLQVIALISIAVGKYGIAYCIHVCIPVASWC